MKNAEVVVVGSFVQDLAFNTATLPAPGETRIGQFMTGPGGKGFNQAVACHRQGIRTAYIGACGEDLFAESLRTFVQSEGMTALLQETPDQATGAAAILVDSAGRNSIVVALGANDYLTREFVEQQRQLFAAKPITLVQAECNLEATVAALEMGRKAGGITILNPAPINNGMTAEILGLADILTPNETEFQFLQQHLFGNKIGTDLLNMPRAELNNLANTLGAPTVVITLGDQGAFVSHNPSKQPAGKNFRVTDGEQYYLVPALKVKTVDTTGAGDAFSGGLAAGLARFPDDFRTAVQYASVVAALSTESPGTAPSMPTRQAVDLRFGANAAA